MNSLPADQPEPQPMSLFDRWINLFAAPGELFEHLRRAPVSALNWLVPILVFIIVSWICSAIFFSQDWAKQKVRDMYEQAIEQQLSSGNLTEQQKEEARARAYTIAEMSTRIGAYAGPVVSSFAGCFIWAVYLWLIGTKVLKGSFTLMKMVEVVGITFLVSTVGVIVKTMVTMITGNLVPAIGPGLLLGEYDQNNPLHQILTLVDLFMLWVLLLRAIGLARLTSRSVGVGTVWVFGGWLVWSGALVMFGMVMKALASR
jgi:hypothetical protein